MPDTLDFTKFPIAPSTDDASIHPYRQEIFNKLVSGWTPARVASILSAYYGAEITEKSVTEYREKIPDEVAIRVPYLHKLLHLIDIEIDPMGEMQRVLKLAAIRLDYALEREEEAKNRTEDRPTPGQIRKLGDRIDKAAKTYWKFLGDYVERIALIKGAHASRDVLMPQKVPTVREIMAQTAPTERVVDAASKLLPAPKDEAPST